MSRPADRPRVLLVGWDAADWKLIHPLLDRGELPTLARIIEGGVSGNLASLQPMLSPMLWTSIATGKRACDHGVRGFTEVDGATGMVQPVGSTDRTVKALWNILAQNGYRAQVVGWFATHPAEALPGGASVSDAFLALDPPPANGVHPERLRETLAELRVRPEEIDADVLRLFVPDLERAVEARDGRVPTLRARLAESFSTHAAATYLLEHEPADFTAVYYRAIDWISHDFMPFHAPAMAGVSAADAALYGEVVNGIYRLHDLLLSRLLILAGEAATVVLVSDHGFHSDHLRPAQIPNVAAGIANWHRPTGVLAMRGPALLTDELVHGATLLDIAPTVLALFGLPPGTDMPGRVLREAFREPPNLLPGASWETVAGDDGRSCLTGVARLDAREAEALRRQFEAIGYLAPVADDLNEAASQCRRENRWNLARALLDASRHAEALELLETIYEEQPERGDFGLQLANCQLTLGLEEAAMATLGTVLAGQEEGALAKLILGNVAYRCQAFPESLRLLRAAEALDATLPGLHQQTGLTLIALADWTGAEAAFRRALEIDGDDAPAHLGVAHTLLRRARYAEAVEWALSTLGLRFDLPLAHFTLGRALARLGETVRARQAFETCLRHLPEYSPAHRFLAYLYRQAPNPDFSRARSHREQTGRAESRTLERARHDEALRTRVADRAQERAKRRAQTVAPAAKGPSFLPATTDAEPLDLLIVSGLPRSGTSLMMRMLAAGGLPLLTDDARPADEDNPEGYFEWQPIKRLPREPHLIEQAAGRVIKVVSTLLPALPRRHHYRIIFMMRPLEEIAASQRRMRARHEPVETLPSTEQLSQWLEKHRAGILQLLRSAENVSLHEVDYPVLVRNPVESVQSLATWLGGTLKLKQEMMPSVVNPGQYRIRLATTLSPA